MRWKALLILLLIILALIPAYAFNKYMQKILRPRESIGRLMAYLISGMISVFLFTLLVVYIIKRLFPDA